jgi:hypothetical protein
MGTRASETMPYSVHCSYAGGYANQHYPLNAPGIQQRAYFEAHFQAMYSQLGNRVVALQVCYRVAAGAF